VHHADETASLLLLIGNAATAHAQLATITAPNFLPAPPSADPQGTWGKPANNGAWKVTFDYGTVAAGTFKRDLTIGIGGDVILPVAGASGVWGPIGRENLKNPLPATTHVRARMQKMVGQQWVDQGAPAYFPIP